ncbi:MAG: CooT family nickel-binding protein [Oscillospiraceae bacterium]|jgi:predicted RNA-binding protein|nr:CooT family nickel-binding protein [Oscillospiraceae bacterium]
MCLSTVYRDKVSAENIVLSNVTRIECKDGMVILTDLLERQVAIHGQLLMANLIDGLAIIREEG